MNPADDGYKNSIGNQIMRRLSNAVRTNAIELDELPDIASFILSRLPDATDYEEIISFLRYLAFEWPVFVSLYEFERINSSNSADDSRKKIQFFAQADYRSA